MRSQHAHTTHARTTRAGVLTGTVLLVGVLLTGTASAHVTVSSTDAARGSYSVLTFRVPTEMDTPTTKLVVTLPDGQALPTVSPQVKPGWTVTMTKAKLATPVTDDDGNKINDGIGSITWTATGGGVPAGTFDTFSIEAGPLPEQPTIAFRAEQTYQGGQVVDWADPTVPGGAEPDHPAPVLHLTSATGTDTPAAAGSVSSTPLAAPVSTASDSTGRTLGIIGIVVGALGLAAGGTALAASRRRPAAHS